MKFYGRESELDLLNEARRRSEQNSQMSVVIGRRRVGKTRLILHSLKDDPHLYFFVSKKAENLLCQDFTRQIEEVYAERAIAPLTTFEQVFRFVCQIASRRHVNLVIDEFQEFSQLNNSVFSDLQRDWDLNKNEIKLNLILCGSVQSMMNRIFLDAREPLFGRASSILRVGAFEIQTLTEVIQDHFLAYTREDLLALYAVTGGVAQYVEYLVERSALSFDLIIDAVFSPQSIFLNEGRYALIQDLGKDYTTYFSILSLIAAGFTTRPKIESVLQKPVGGQLIRLERIYGLIARRKPIYSKENSTDIKFYIVDNFFRFWFRFVFKYQELVEAKNLEALKLIVRRDYRTFAGLVLEDFLREQLRQEMKYTKVGNYWERGNKNEIDIVAINEINRTAIIGEVKWQRERVSIPKLEMKAEKLVRDHLRKYKVTYVAYGLEDVSK
jgi:AAA+ ATPase superfamily predicted ATPase